MLMEEEVTVLLRIGLIFVMIPVANSDHLLVQTMCSVASDKRKNRTCIFIWLADIPIHIPSPGMLTMLILFPFGILCSFKNADHPDQDGKKNPEEHRVEGPYLERGRVFRCIVPDDIRHDQSDQG